MSWLWTADEIETAATHRTGPRPDDALAGQRHGEARLASLHATRPPDHNSRPSHALNFDIDVNLHRIRPSDPCVREEPALEIDGPTSTSAV